MRRPIIFALLAGGLTAIAVPGAGIAQPQPQPHPSPLPSLRDEGQSLSVRESLARLAPGRPVSIRLSARANATATCAPGRLPGQPHSVSYPINVSGTASYPPRQLVGGHLAYMVRTERPASLVAGAPHCANRRWTETITDLAFTSATLSIEQPTGRTVYRMECIITPPSTNGPIASRQLRCSRPVNLIGH